MATTQENNLRRGVDELGLSLSDEQVGQLLSYVTEFAKWNRAYNLSAVRDIDAMISRHLLDSLAVVPHIHADRVIDVGTGGGLPGIPLAICFPHTHFTLLDSNGKKTRFLFHVKTRLGLSNVQIENTRVEAYVPTALYGAVISRAFASIADMVTNCRHLLAGDGEFLAMKGVYPAAELADAANFCQEIACASLKVPGETGERCLLRLAAR